MNIVILDGKLLNPGDVDWGPLEALGNLKVYDDSTVEQVPQRAAGADVVLINKVPLRRETLAQLPDVKMVGVVATGYDVVDIEAFAERNIPVCNVVAYGVNDVAQHVMALLLELCHRTSEHTQSIRSGQWTDGGEWCYWMHTPVCLEGMTLGLVGYGNIGRRVGELGHAFGMKVLANRRNPKNPPSYAPFSFATLDQVLAQSDVVSLHCPLTEATRGLINKKSLAKMKRGAILLNAARGPLVNEDDVAAALHSGQLGGYGADVMVSEPPVRDNPLFSTPNTLLTPHMAWATVRARQNIINLTAENILRWKEGTPINVVNAVKG